LEVEGIDRLYRNVYVPRLPIVERHWGLSVDTAGIA
jgi:hypothetical protein